MLIEAAKGGHTSVVCYLLDYPNNLLSAPPPEATLLTPLTHDLNRVQSENVDHLGILECCFLFSVLNKIKTKDAITCHERLLNFKAKK